MIIGTKGDDLREGSRAMIKGTKGCDWVDKG